MPEPDEAPKGMVWCPEHQRLERADDLIDFPCSDTYLDFYYRQGLTPRKSPNYFMPDLRIAQLQAEVAALSRRVADLHTRHTQAALLPATPPKQADPTIKRRKRTRGIEV